MPPVSERKLAPLALFVYNRPWHTEQAIEALLRNELAGDSDLYIFSDGPKTAEARRLVQDVRDFVRTVKGFKSIEIVEQEQNCGLANSIIHGVSTICERYGKVIVLEDDLITSPYFLHYMNDGLDAYENDPQVISIHGYIYPVRKVLPETFLLRGADCWGWGTWKRGWDLFEKDGEGMLNQIRREHLVDEFNYDGAYDLLSMLSDQVAGKIDSWAIRWYASAFLKNRLTLYPGKSLIRNIGTDSSGTHCGTTEFFSGDLGTQAVKVNRIPLTECRDARAAISTYLRSSRQSIFERIAGKSRNLIMRAGRSLARMKSLGQ